MRLRPIAWTAALVLWTLCRAVWLVLAVGHFLLLSGGRRRYRGLSYPDRFGYGRVLDWLPGRRYEDPEPAGPVRQRVQRTAQERAALVLLLRRRDGDLCQLCLEPLDFAVPQSHPDAEEVDHIVPFSLGGDCHIDNARLAHRGCNQSRGNRMDLGETA